MFGTYSLEQYAIIIGANIPCMQPLVVAIFHEVKSTYSHDRTTHFPLDDMSVQPEQSIEGSTNAILSRRNREGFEETSSGSVPDDHKDHDTFPDSPPGILKTVDMDVRYGSDASAMGNASRIV